jgi:5-hydroxyisourate hydrolase-like protein (transthyretin family)
MLDYIDNMVRQLLITQVPGITDAMQVRFQPPDDDWRTYVSTLGKSALNVYLIELKENRVLRSCGRIRTVSGGIITEKQLPRWIDVHYFITAWDPATGHPAVEPTIAEHELLWDTSAALMDAGALIPTAIYAPDPLPAGFPALIGDAELPTTVLPADGFAKHAEFWGTMPGQNHPWRPAVLLILSIPVVQPVISTSYMVTTRITDYGLLAGSGAPDVWAEIGGLVLDATVVPAAPVSGATVVLADMSGNALATTTTDAQGRFIFNTLRTGNYELQFSATGHPAAAPRNITVPSLTGEYNLKFT